MPITSGQTTVGTVSTQIDGSDDNPSFLRIHNNDNTKTLYVGGSDVTISNGLAVLKQEAFDIILHPGATIYAVTDSGTHVVSWLRQTI